MVHMHITTLSNTIAVASIKMCLVQDSIYTTKR